MSDAARGNLLSKPPMSVRTLLFSTLYPSSADPLRGVFVETRLRELLSTGQVTTKVVAPVPWFYSKHPKHGRFARMASAPRRESLNDIDVLHPRYLVVPKVGMHVAPILLALGARPAIARLIDEGFDFDIIDAHYYYPDGVAAAILARWFRKRLVITARGTDLNLIPKYRWPRTQIKWAADRADASIGVCTALMDVLRDWQVEPHKLHVMRNGVDLTRFRPIPQLHARSELGLQGDPLLISVGHMTERKGHHVAIDAAAELRRTHSNVKLVIVGNGEEHDRLVAQTRRLGLEAHVQFSGSIPNAELHRWYSAADVLVLASSREGWPNVLLEAMACGTPVVATSIWGTPEVVQGSVAGRLVEQRDGAAFAAAVVDMLRAGIDRGAVRLYAEGFSWEQTSHDQLALFRRLAASA